MAYIVEVSNPLEPLKSCVKRKVTGGLFSVRGWLENTYEGFQEFAVPTICIHNGKALLRRDWDTTIIEDRDVVQFIALPGYGWEALIVYAILILVAVTLVVSLGAPAPPLPGEAPASDPVFSVKGQSNAIRLGEPIEVCYGRNRIYPSLASRPYFQYQDNDQYEYTLLCIGKGYFEISALQIGDTDIDSYQEVEYQIIEPGDPVTLFPTNVITSVEAGGQTLFAPNEAEYVAPGWVGPFAASPSNTEAFRIQIDMLFPKGIYNLRENGNLDDSTIEFEFEARLIDNAGFPAGSFFLLGHEVVTATTTTPQRKTYSYDVPLGRYEVRARRTFIKDLSYRSGSDLVWEGLRGFVDVEQDYGEVTLWAIKIRATNNLNDKTKLQFNCIATRKLPVYDPETGGMTTELFETRSIVWAFVDIFRAKYGARIEDDRYFDLEALSALDAVYISRGDHFDWVFRDPTTCWDAGRAIARAGRATPILSGSLITMIRDSPQELAVAMFTSENILSETIEESAKFWELVENDSLRIEYTDPTTGYKQEQVLVTLPGGTYDNPKDVRLPGVQDRQQAYREGLFMLATEQYVRTNIVFETGLEGYIPTFGDLVLVSIDTHENRQSGFIVNAENSGDDWILTLSEPISWTSSSSGNQILLRQKNGDPLGPFDVSPTEDPMQVAVTIPDSSELDFLLAGDTEPMLYLFGETGNISRYGRVIRVEPSTSESVRITLVNDAPVIHSFDDLPAPELTELPLAPKAPDLPIVAHIYINQIDPTLQIVQISWSAAFGAQYYVVQTSEDGVNWREEITTVRTSLQMQFHPGPLYVRVAGVNSGRGPWAEGDTTLSYILGIDLTGDWDNELNWSVGWLPVIGAEYRVKVYDNSGSAPVFLRSTSTSTLNFTYDLEDAIEDGAVVRDMLVTVDTIIGGADTGAPAELELHNSIPSPVTDVEFLLV